MKLVFETTITQRLNSALGDAARDNKKVDCILLTQDEYGALAMALDLLSIHPMPYPLAPPRNFNGYRTHQSAAYMGVPIYIVPQEYQ